MAESVPSYMGESSRLPPVPVDTTSDLISEETTAAAADLLAFSSSYNEYFKDAKKQPEADIRPRLLVPRNKVAKFVEYIVKSRWRDVENSEKEWCAVNDPLGRKDMERRYGEKMVGFLKVLLLYSQINDADTKATQACKVDQFIMDNTIRRHMNSQSTGSNAQLCEEYGAVGEPAPASHFAMRGPEDNLLRRILLNKLLVPVDQSIFNLQEKYRKHKGQNIENQDAMGEVRNVPLEMVARILECMIAAGCFAGSVVLLYYLRSTRNKLIAAPFMSFVCALPVSFLSKQSQGLFMLMAGIWAVLAVIVFLQVGSLPSMNQ
ncbi:hypothetical protein DM02DRAFT_155921 [Periconia macrospinosa]|uniref:Uncharacterized protein n=1 Tax=Periconia macrospinosa TaxID=97972 RepID=A0A2V1EER9_9PLEO|nr:hypothetical protein DM02DRAFT_155921 [Periconia macrospinosa]